MHCSMKLFELLHEYTAARSESREYPLPSQPKAVPLREGCRKSKWKFKMAFAMKGGGSRGGLECHIPILKNDFY